MAQDRIEIDTRIQGGKPVIRGTRVPVHILLGSLAGGLAVDEVAEEYGVEREDVQAALEYAAHCVSGEDLFP